MYLHCRPDETSSPILYFLLINWSFKYGFEVSLTLLITCCDIRTCICSVGRIWVHLLISQRSLISASFIWSTKFVFSSKSLKLALLITCYDIKASIWSVGQMLVYSLYQSNLWFSSRLFNTQFGFWSWL